jgi:hypothetical protein
MRNEKEKAKETAEILRRDWGGGRKEVEVEGGKLFLPSLPKSFL